MMMLWTALTLGFLGSLHCLGMCGPLVMAIPSTGKTNLETAANVTGYHTSRLAAYALLGILPGVIGAGLHVTAAQQWISIIVGILFLVGCVISLRGQLRISIGWVDRASNAIQNLFFRYSRSGSRSHLLGLGFLNGLIPCGMVYMAMAAALGTGSVTGSMLFMIAFGAGTVPIFFGLAFIQSRKVLNLRPYLIKLIPVSLAILGVIFLWRGLAITVPADLSILKEMGWSVMCH